MWDKYVPSSTARRSHDKPGGARVPRLATPESLEDYLKISASASNGRPSRPPPRPGHFGLLLIARNPKATSASSVPSKRRCDQDLSRGSSTAFRTPRKA